MTGRCDMSLNNAVHLAAPGNFLFASEAVSEGNPDKVCDQISDAVVDACLAQDPHSQVTCVACLKASTVIVIGEITTTAIVDYEAIVRRVIEDIGYDTAEKGIDYKTCCVLEALNVHSTGAAGGDVCVGHVGQGVIDQGITFGYATDETPSLMPLTIDLANRLGKRLAAVRKDGTCGWLHPDGRTHVTVEYRDEGGAMVPVRVHAVVICVQHENGIADEDIHAQLHKHVVLQVVPAELLDANTTLRLYSSGRHVSRGTGLTGRKIISDTYGGWGAHGGGVFSGKDPVNVGRAAAYASRWVAKSLVAAKLARRASVQLCYAPGVSGPVSSSVHAYGTSPLSDAELLALIHENFDLRPSAIVAALGLHRPIYRVAATFGHFGRDDLDAAWEKPKQLKLPHTAASPE